TSRRLPIGVATTYNEPGSARNARSARPFASVSVSSFPAMRAPLRPASLTPRLAQRATCILRAVLFAAAALSCASSRPATRVEVIRAPIEEPHAAPPIVPMPDETVVAPVIVNPALPPAEAPDAIEAPIGADDALPAPVTGDLIALVLPLDVPAYERAAGAVRDGFLDAADAAGRRDRCIVISHGADGVISAFE